MYEQGLKITQHLKGVVLDGPVKLQNTKFMSLKEARKLEMVLNKCMRRRMEGGVSTLSNVALMCGYISPNAHRIWVFAICPFKPMLDLPHLFCFIPESTAVNNHTNQICNNVQE